MGGADVVFRQRSIPRSSPATLGLLRNEGTREMIEDNAKRYRALRMEDVIDLERLCSRLDQCVTVIPGGVDSRTLQALEERGYDQAPVYDANTHCYWGLVQTEYLRSLFKLGQPLLQDDPVIRDESMSSTWDLS